jgi:glycosyltransferase involved in cell wall biosynthesis
MNRQTIAGIVITKNEEMNIGACLDSLRWVDELIVVDAESTDRTVELTRSYTSKVFVRPWPGYGPQKNFAMEQATTDWILIVDADERIPEDLRQEILGILRSPSPSVNAYRLPRRNYYYGHWIRYANQYPDLQLRLVRRKSGRYNDLPVHEHLEGVGPIEDMSAALYHHTSPTVVSHELKIERYSTLAAYERCTAGRPDAFWYHLIFNPAWTFVKLYLLRQGFRDGIPGLLVCAFSSAHVLLKYAKLWEQRQGGRQNAPG